MDCVGKPEIATQKRVIDFFQTKLRYNYIGNLKDRETRNIDEEKLITWLTKHGYAKAIAVRAVEELVKAATNLQDGLYSANREVYRLLKYGAQVKANADENETTVYFIDWETPGENIFDIAEEVTVVANNEKRPDLVIYLNGIAVAIIELKKSTVSVSNGIRQNLTNQREMFIEPFFTTIQFCMAGNDSEGLRYGTIKTPEKYYLEWKKDGFTEYPEERNEMDVHIEEVCDTISNKLDSGLFAMFYKARFLNLIHNFLIFDKGQKKVCRYNQYYGMRAQKRLSSGKGGIIWHTQGSGKSLTMIWLSKWLLSNIPTARVLIVTDRDELDEQIERNYIGVNETIIRTKSGADLLNRLNSHEDTLLCSLICHKSAEFLCFLLHSLQSHDPFPVCAGSQHGAGQYRTFIHQHSTETTVCSLTATFYAVTAVFPQEIQKQFIRTYLCLPFYTIQPESDIHSALPPISSQALLVRTFTRRLLYSFEARMFLSVGTCSAAYAAKDAAASFFCCAFICTKSFKISSSSSTIIAFPGLAPMTVLAFPSIRAAAQVSTGKSVELFR